MCTVTFIPRQDGFFFAMNRDEQLSREQAFSPAFFQLGASRALFPHEKSGGSWIGINDSGIVAAVLNRSVQVTYKKSASRGMLIPALLKARNLSESQAWMETADLNAMLPFRAIVIAGLEKRILEYEWNGDKLDRKSFSWASRHWFSSGLSDEKAAFRRTSVCKSAWKVADAGSLPWLRRLHRSHRPGPGPFSMCVHRANVRTVSYTELQCDGARMTMRYRPGSPCQPAETTEYELRLPQIFPAFVQIA